MSNIYKKGSKVFWKWGRGGIARIIEEVYLEPVEKKIKNTAIKRKASKDNPAYYIKEEKKMFLPRFCNLTHYWD
jgi:hypothetical protein